MCINHRKVLRIIVVIISIFIAVGISKAEIRGFYKFNNTSNLGLDSSGCGNHAIWGDTAYTPGYAGYAFLGTGQTYFELGQMFPDSVDTYTATAWIKKLYTAVDAYEYIYYDPYSQIGLHYQKSGSEINYSWASQGSPGDWRSRLVVPLNKWVFVAMVVEPSKATVYLYKDGQMSSAIHNYPHQALPSNYSYIAGQYWYDPYNEQAFGFFRGAIDDLRIYNHALTSGEILSLANGTNSPPRIDAGEDQGISTPTTTLNGSAQDDGMPNPPAMLTENWSKVSGPGTVTFTPAANILNPEITFSAYGTYVLKLTVSDGLSQVDDTVTVTYQPVYISSGAIKVTSSEVYGDFANPDVNVLINGSGLSDDGLHNNSFYDMCYIWDTTDSQQKYDREISTDGRVWIAFEFDRIYTLNKILVWNYNDISDYGMNEITIAYSTDKDSWAEFDYELNRAPGQTTQAQAESIYMNKLPAKYVVIIARSNYQAGSQSKFGLSEVKFEYSGVNGNKASSPDPANGSTNPALDARLSWLTGVSPTIVSHNVYISLDGNEVENRTCPHVNTDDPYYITSGLTAGQVYYWAVDSLDVYGNIVPSGKGDLWNFTIKPMEIRNAKVNGALLGKIPMEKVQIYGNGNYRGEAQVARSKNGELYAVIYDTHILFKSSDDGRTWNYKSLTPLMIDPCDGHPVFTIQKDDSFFAIYPPWVAFDPHYSEADRVDYKRWVTVKRSKDYGDSWDYSAAYAEPGDTNTYDPNIYAIPDYNTMVEGALTMTRTYDGRLLYPVRRWSWQQDYAKHGMPNAWYDRYSAQAIVDGRHEFNLFYSDNNGLSWKKTKTFNFTAETHVIQLQSGKLLGAFRYQRYWIPSGVPGFSPDTESFVRDWGGDIMWRDDTAEGPMGSCVFKNVFVGESFDNGVTWKNLHPLQDANGNALVVYGQAHGDLVQVPDGRVVMVHDHRYPTNERQIIARVSNDEGATWEPEVYKITLGDGYPSSVALEDGKIITVTGDDLSEPYTSAAIRWRLPAKKAGTPIANLKVVRRYAIVGREVLLDASDSNDVENNIVKYEWDFEGNNKFDYYETADTHSDGEFNGKTKHVYTTAGEYNQRVRVTDSNGLNDSYNVYHIIVSEDLDGDDMPDEWERRHALDPSDGEDGSADYDDDGYTNLSEYLHQSNPYNDRSPVPSTILLVSADVADCAQAQALAIPGDQIIVDLSGDLNNDKKVNAIDFAMFVQNWMDTGCGLCGGADFTGDGNVDQKDLVRIVENWLAGN